VLLSKQRTIEVLRRERLGLTEFAYEMRVGAGEALRMATGLQPLDYGAAKRFMDLVGFNNFAYAAESEEVRIHAKRIAAEYS